MEQEERKMSEVEKYEMEIAAINILQEVGVSFRVPLKIEEISHKKKWYHIFTPKKTETLSNDRFDVITTKIPNPLNPQKEIEQYLADIKIKPLFLETIDSIRAKMLEIHMAESELNEKLDQDNGELLKYSLIMCEIVAIATVNGKLSEHKKDIIYWKEFYYEHLTSTRLFKLVHVIVAMMDTMAFRSSIRLVKEMGTTSPRKATRIEKEASKD